jgi:antitoxin component of MazEF toxin-antitoxin module
MATRVRIQRVERKNSRSFYVNLPVVLVEAIGIQKGEVFEWSLEDKNTLVFTRVNQQSKRDLRSRPR